MSPAPTVTTERLRLRAFMDADREPFAVLNADPRVMEHFPEPYTRERSDAFVDRIAARWSEFGYGLWAVERRDFGVFIGYVGLWPALFEAPFTPAVEVGWRLAAQHWGRGFATEGAREALRHGFDVLDMDEIVSFTAVGNVRSWKVMERLGMHRDVAGDFEHPLVPPGYPVRPHVLYRLPRERWRQSVAPPSTQR